VIVTGSKRLALVSVTDKAGLVEFGRGLVANGFELLSTGGTAKALRTAGIAVTEVSDFTGFPEILDGRVKTLQARLLGGILARTHLASDRADLERQGIVPIEIVAVNLYRFGDAAARFRAGAGAGARGLEAEPIAGVIEEIDIGGPTLVRAAAKNAGRVLVVVDPADYGRVIAATEGGAVAGEPLRAQLAAKAFRAIARYDAEIASFFDSVVDPAATAAREGGPVADGSALELISGDLPPGLSALGAPLRYGENPHQTALVVRGRDPGEASVLHARVLMGKELSYNNLLDADAALELVKEFDRDEAGPPAAVIVKHNNPCGCAIGETPIEALERAYAGDPLSAFGGILALNRPVDEALAAAIAVPERFFEVLVAPAIEASALERLRAGAAWGKNLRVLACGDTRVRAADAPRFAFRSLVGGVLVQERDLAGRPSLEARTRRRPTGDEERELLVAWKIVKHVRSNAIVLVKDGALVGAGAGQTSRVDSVEIAVRKAGTRAHGAVLASDAFFPFRDGLDAAARSGVTAVIQPGGSRRDAEVIAAADEHGIAMVFTGVRHFRH
jgi:phosphoribosylaminoimidazolecarboxamide formyltransferase/IMP cyclohydrolase